MGSRLKLFREIFKARIYLGEQKLTAISLTSSYFACMVNIKREYKEIKEKKQEGGRRKKKNKESKRKWRRLSNSDNGEDLCWNKEVLFRHLEWKRTWHVIHKCRSSVAVLNEKQNSCLFLKDVLLSTGTPGSIIKTMRFSKMHPTVS